MRLVGLGIWYQSATFFLRHWRALLPISPLLWCPLISDVLHALLIRAETEGRPLDPVGAVKESLRILPAHLRLKLFYFSRAMVWAVVPVYGLMRDVEERLRWAMVSNVLAFEGYRDIARTRARCDDLVATHRRIAHRTLFDVPLLIFVLVSLLVALGTTPVAFWGAVALWWWTLIPGAGAANTYLYIEITRDRRMSPTPESSQVRTLPAVANGPMRKATTILAAGCFLGACSPGRTPYSPEWDALSAEICVERDEDHGCMNVHPSRITLFYERPRQLRSETIVTGGQAFCFFVMPGRYSLEVSSKEACWPEPESREVCMSAPYPVVVSEKEVVQLKVAPKPTREEYDCGWEISPRGSR